ncbi:MAG: type IV secretory system conjugative DNA transfer family protein [Saccharofermentans sp.]|nr:type IV secretory system conjugative DNA transfer family protein [Saccharofermentans sp.]
MKNRMLQSTIIGVGLGGTYYLLGPTVLHSFYDYPIFSREYAAAIALLVSVAGFKIAYDFIGDTSEYEDDVFKKSPSKQKALRRAPSKEFLSKQPNGLTVGRFKRHYVGIPFYSSPEHQLIIGAPGEGKSVTMQNAIIYDFNFATSEEKLCSMLVLDVKPELSRRGVYEGRDDIKIINPTVFGSCGFNIFYGLTSKTTDDELSQRFSMIADTVIQDSGADNRFFSDAAKNIFTAFLMYGFVTGKQFGECIEEMRNVPVSDLIAQIITDDRMDNHSKIKRLISEFDGKTSDGFQDVAMTLKNDLAVFDDDKVKACFASTNPKKVSPLDLINGISVFLAIPEHEVKRLASVQRLIVNTCLECLMSQDEARRSNKRPIWVLIDEAGSIGKLPILGDVLARGRSKGIQVSLVIQSEGQLDTTYGRDMTRAIKDCCKTTIVFGSNDLPTCEAISKRTGVFSERKTSTTTRGSSASSTRSSSQEYRPAVDVADIQNLSRDNKLLVFARGDWFIVKKAPYFTIPMLNDKSAEIEKLNAELHDESTSY